MKTLCSILIACLFILICSTTVLHADQPTTGPGSGDYAHASVTKAKFGRGAKAYYIFEPADPTPVSAPVVVFMHGLFGTSPSYYIGWINHITRRGNIVVFPVYQSMISGVSSRKFAVNSIHAILDSLTNMFVTPELDKVAMVGHSAGALLTANLTATATEVGLPPIKAAMCVAPGITPIFKLEDMTQIPPSTLLITVAGDRDMLVGTKDAKKVFNKATQVINRNYIYVNSDRGNQANHFAALSGSRRNNNIDHFCYWKIFDALCDAAFYDCNWCYCFGNTPEQVYMGKLRNGDDMKALTVTLPDLLLVDNKEGNSPA